MHRSGGINGRYRSTECPCHRQFQPLVHRFVARGGGGGCIRTCTAEMPKDAAFVAQPRETWSLHSLDPNSNLHLPSSKCFICWPGFRCCTGLRSPQSSQKKKKTSLGCIRSLKGLFVSCHQPRRRQGWCPSLRSLLSPVLLRKGEGDPGLQYPPTQTKLRYPPRSPPTTTSKQTNLKGRAPNTD